jgi:hypothetical protein
MTKNSARVVLSILLVLVFAGATARLAAAKTVTLVKPQPLSPVDNTEFTNLPRTTTLAWFPVAEAVNYSVSLEYSSSGTAGSYNTVTGFPVTVPNTDATLQLTEAELGINGDGFYAWTVTAVGNDSDIKSSSASKVQIFSYNTVKTLETPARISPANGALFFDSLTVTLAWDSRPAVTTAPSEGYSVSIEQETSPHVWTPVSGSPFSVSTISGFNWQNSSYTFTATTTGTYRWAVQAEGDGTLAKDSPAPTKPKDWWTFTFSN